MPLLSFGEIRLCHEIIWSLVESKTDYRKTVKVLLHFHQQHLVTVITKSICTELVRIKLYTIFLLLPFYFSLYFFFFVLFFSFPDRFFTHVFFSLLPRPRSARSHTTVRGRESLKAQMRSFYQSLTICVSGSLQHCPLGYWGYSPHIPSLHTHKCSSIK